VEVDQDLALSPILSAFYLSPILHIFEKQLKNIKIPISFLSFVDNSLLFLKKKSTIYYMEHKGRPW